MNFLTDFLTISRPLGSKTISFELEYDFLLIWFASAKDYAAYLAHPNHVALVEKWKPRLTMLEVYDVIDESP